MLTGIRHLHSLNTVHYDTNPSGILFEHDSEPVIIDFDSCRQIRKSLHQTHSCSKNLKKACATTTPSWSLCTLFRASSYDSLPKISWACFASNKSLMISSVNSGWPCTVITLFGMYIACTGHLSVYANSSAPGGHSYTSSWWDWCKAYAIVFSIHFKRTSSLIQTFEETGN